jgi:hypothetical protein
MNKTIIGSIGVISVVLLFMIGLYTGNSPEFTIDKIRSKFNGVVSNIFFDRTYHYSVSLNDGTIKDIAYVTGDFLCSVEIGDSIDKIENENYVYVYKFNNRKKIKVLYTIITDREREDFRWPEEWKNKWIGSSFDYETQPCNVSDKLKKYKNGI